MLANRQGPHERGHHTASHPLVEVGGVVTGEISLETHPEPEHKEALSYG